MVRRRSVPEDSNLICGLEQTIRHIAGGSMRYTAYAGRNEQTPRRLSQRPWAPLLMGSRFFVAIYFTETTRCRVRSNRQDGANGVRGLAALNPLALRYRPLALPKRFLNQILVSRGRNKGVRQVLSGVVRTKDARKKVDVYCAQLFGQIDGVIAQVQACPHQG